MNIINERDFSYQNPSARHLRSYHISPDWHGKLDNHPWTVNFDEQMEFWRQMAVDSPEIYFELIGVDCEVYKEYRTADVLMRVAMVRKSVTLLGVCESKWKWSQGRWVWYYHRGMRGIREE